MKKKDKKKNPFANETCLGYGCKNKRKTAAFCEDCYLEYLDDHDAFK